MFTHVVVHEDGDLKSNNIPSEVINHKQDQATVPKELGI